MGGGSGGMMSGGGGGGGGFFAQPLKAAIAKTRANTNTAIATSLYMRTILSCFPTFSLCSTLWVSLSINPPHYSTQCLAYQVVRPGNGCRPVANSVFPRLVPEHVGQ